MKLITLCFRQSDVFYVGKVLKFFINTNKKSAGDADFTKKE